MALQAWIGRTSGQLDADSPLDITLFNGLDDDLIHLKQVVYGNQSGGFLTPVDGHDHDGANSIKVTTTAPDAVRSGQLYKGSVYGTQTIVASGNLVLNNVWFLVVGKDFASTGVLRLDIFQDAGSIWHATQAWLDGSLCGPNGGEARLIEVVGSASATLHYRTQA